MNWHLFNIFEKWEIWMSSFRFVPILTLSRSLTASALTVCLFCFVPFFPSPSLALSLSVSNARSQFHFYFKTGWEWMAKGLPTYQIIVGCLHFQLILTRTLNSRYILIQVITLLLRKCARLAMLVKNVRHSYKNHTS